MKPDDPNSILGIYMVEGEKNRIFYHYCINKKCSGVRYQCKTFEKAIRDIYSPCFSTRERSYLSPLGPLQSSCVFIFLCALPENSMIHSCQFNADPAFQTKAQLQWLSQNNITNKCAPFPLLYKQKERILSLTQ